MAEVHDLICLHGRDGARDKITPKDRHLVDPAANILEREGSGLGITYSGFCLTSLPHRQIAPDRVWERAGDRITLIISPGTLRIGSTLQKFGVPFGSRARMILLYLQTRALSTGSPEVELGPSLSAWMRRMNVPLGGKSRDLIREQANRLSACNLTLYYEDRKGRGFEKDSIIRSGFSFADSLDDDRQSRLWEDKVRLGDLFFKALMESPVPLLEAALREISNKSMALDIYVWLAYLLPTLQAARTVSWKDLHRQFGAGFDTERYFRRHFIEQLKTAVAVYPESRVSVTDDGVALVPGRAPVETRIHVVAALPGRP